MALLLDKLQISNFRSFRSLDIERLGRVNLIVGKNSAGKSTVLEALRIYASRGAAKVLWELLRSREELPPTPDNELLPLDRVTTAFLQLFNGRPTRWRDNALAIGSPTRSFVRVETGHENSSPVIVSGRDGDIQSVDLENDSRFPLHTAIAPHVFIPPDGFTSAVTSKMWDQIALTDLEEGIVEVLRIIVPTVERISFIGETSETRIPVVKLTNERRPVPVRSLGDGASRLLGIAFGLVSASDSLLHGLLLIDEVENGLHYSVQPKLWHTIFALANRLGVQVFATTHSWDCIEAFQRAAAEDANEEAFVIRLDTRNGSVSPVVITERDLELVAEHRIEVR